MVNRPYRRLIALFLVAVLLPCVGLVTLSVRSIRQARELTDKRLADERTRLSVQVRQTLIARLESIKAVEVGARTGRTPNARPQQYADPSVCLVAGVDGGRLVLPWERPRTDPSVKDRSDSPFWEKLRQGEHDEFALGDPAKAARSFSEALQLARRPVQYGEAALALARVLERLSRPADATAHYRQVLALSSDATDALGVPLALYAASRLVTSEFRRVMARVLDDARASCCLSPEALYLLRTVVDTARTHAPTEPDRARALEAGHMIDARIERAEQALVLQTAFPSLGLGAPREAVSSREPRWTLYGRARWFLGVASAAGNAGVTVVALDGRTILDAVNATLLVSTQGGARLRLLDANEAPDPLITPELAGLTVDYPTAAAAARARERGLGQTFYVGTLITMLCITIFGGYLLWRDVQREVRMAEMRSQFVSSVSHELKTPLTSIRMFAETLLLERSADQDARREYLETIVTESERLTRMLDNVLDLAKIERGQKQYRLAPTALADVVQRSVRTMEYPLAQQGFALRVVTNDDLPPITADADAIEQAILNLLTNAMKYSGESRAIDLTVRTANGDAIIEVVDRGVGIPANETPRVLEKFYRVSTPENARIPGAGLGLALVDHVAKAHGGRLEITSVVGVGSTVAIHLPLGARA